MIDYDLSKNQQLFLDTFKNTHDYERALKSIPKESRRAIESSLKKGHTNLAKAYNDFIKSAPLHPAINKVSIQNMYMELYDMAMIDGDTGLAAKMLGELNKMVKGNLATTTTEIIKETKIIGVIDMTIPAHQQLPTGKIIDITNG